MKKIYFILIAATALILTSCGSVNGLVKTVNKPNDVVMTADLRAFIAENKMPSVVLRVPYSTTKVSEQEQKDLEKNTSFYNDLERNLLKAGYTVRDRGLLNNLLQTGQADYAELGKKIQTDIIIEILSVNFGADNKRQTFTNTKKNREENAAYWGATLNPRGAIVECKIIIVDKGLTGAIATLYYTTCTDGCYFTMKPKTSGPIFTYEGRQYRNGLTWNPVYDEVMGYFSQCIIDILQGRG